MPPRSPSSIPARRPPRSGCSRRSTAGLASTVETAWSWMRRSGPLDERQSFYTQSVAHDPASDAEVRGGSRCAGRGRGQACPARTRASRRPRDPPGHGLLQRILCPWFRHRPGQATAPAQQAWLVRISASWAARAHSTGCAWPVRFSTPIPSPACCSAPSNSAACTISMAGTPTRSWPTHSSPTVPPRSWPSSRESAGSHQYRVVASGSVVIGDSEDAMSWRIGNQGFEMTLSPRVPDLICQHLRPWLETGWPTMGWTWRGSAPGRSIRVAHGSSRPSPKRPAWITLALEASHQVLADHGNMSSPTILFILDRLRRAHAPRPCVAPSLRSGPDRRSRPPGMSLRTRGGRSSDGRKHASWRRSSASSLLCNRRPTCMRASIPRYARDTPPVGSPTPG